MFLPLKYGTKTILIGIYEPPFYQCPNCKGLNTIDFAFTSTYYHFWHIPVFPIEKDGYAKCSDCNFKIDSIKYSRLTKDEFQKLKKKFRHPFYTYTLAGIFASPFIIGGVAYFINK
jgi:hypothetical protein